VTITRHGKEVAHLVPARQGISRELARAAVARRRWPGSTATRRRTLSALCSTGSPTPAQSCPRCGGSRSPTV
jgi:antitoxin (DNA-binding transcriptional repressor) of toxin-antitoxin stability system